MTYRTVIVILAPHSRLFSTSTSDCDVVVNVRVDPIPRPCGASGRIQTRSSESRSKLHCRTWFFPRVPGNHRRNCVRPLGSGDALRPCGAEVEDTRSGCHLPEPPRISSAPSLSEIVGAGRLTKVSRFDLCHARPHITERDTELSSVFTRPTPVATNCCPPNGTQVTWSGRRESNPRSQLGQCGGGVEWL